MRVDAVLKGIDLAFETAAGVFSPNAIDRGTSLLLSLVEFGCADKVLDLGCGYGVMGIFAAKQLYPSRVYMLDSDRSCRALPRRSGRCNTNQREARDSDLLAPGLALPPSATCPILLPSRARTNEPTSPARQRRTRIGIVPAGRRNWGSVAGGEPASACPPGTRCPGQGRYVSS